MNRLQEAIKKGQDVLVQLRDKSLADTQREKLPNPMYLAWNDDAPHGGGSLKMSFRCKTKKGDRMVRPESLTSVMNFVKAKNHHQELSMSRFKHIEDLMLCAEMAWAVREAHQEVIFHVSAPQNNSLCLDAFSLCARVYVAYRIVITHRDLFGAGIAW